jgi:hypothetical protein
MTRYDPIADCIEDGADAVTTDDMVEAGYDDFDDEGGAAEALLSLASALRQMGAMRGDDSAAWYAANDVLAAMRAIERSQGVRATFEVHTETVTRHPEWADEPFETEQESLSVSLERR